MAWVLIMYFGLGFGKAEVVVANIATEKDCYFLGNSIKDTSPYYSAPICFKYNKAPG